MGVLFLSTSPWDGCLDDPHQSRNHTRGSSHQNGPGEAREGSPFKCQHTSLRSSGAL